MRFILSVFSLTDLMREAQSPTSGETSAQKNVVLMVKSFIAIYT